MSHLNNQNFKLLQKVAVFHDELLLFNWDLFQLILIFVEKLMMLQTTTSKLQLNTIFFTSQMHSKFQICK